MRTKIFFDTEFTALHRSATLISIGLISEDCRSFYAEFTDYDIEQCNDWVKENVINKLYINDVEYKIKDDINISLYQNFSIKSDKFVIKYYLEKWFKQFDKVEMWADCLAYDWVLFCNIFGNAFSIPENIYYIPFDLATLFKVNGIDPDINREEFAFKDEEIPKDIKKHNALWDANVIKKCYERIISNEWE